MTENPYLRKIADSIIDCDQEAALEATHAALEAGLDPVSILNEGLVSGAEEVGRLFENGEYYLPELMMAGKALKASMEVIRPRLAEQYAGAGGAGAQGKVVIATVQTDIHDIGKNLVASMLAATGLEVIDMGVDVPIKSIVDKAEEVGANVIALSALLTTSMPFIQDTIELLKARSLRSKYRVIVGGASVTPVWAARIGADGTAPNAADAVRLVRKLLEAQ
jgi:corrinoid protein of di/trimethylamine methyltransferase